MMQKKILLCNDDGIAAPGLKVIYNELLSWAEVSIIVPEVQQSGQSKSLTFNEPVRVQKVELWNGDEGHTISGTSADSVLFGLNLLKRDQPFDLVVAGINAGENTSAHSILTSATCAAALEASFFGVPAVAFSLDVDEKFYFNNNLPEPIFKVPAILASSIVRAVLSLTFPSNLAFLNVNFPKEVSLDTPMRITFPAKQKYTNYPIQKTDPRGVPYFWLWGNLLEDLPEGSDSKVLLKDREISITPVGFDLSVLDESNKKLLAKIINSFK